MIVPQVGVRLRQERYLLLLMILRSLQSYRRNELAALRGRNEAMRLLLRDLPVLRGLEILGLWGLVVGACRHLIEMRVLWLLYRWWLKLV